MTEESVACVDGPWRHRTVSAGGTRFHVVELGEGPLVLLLHGFPEFWWSWHRQVVSLAEAGYRAAAIDLRGYGASDKPPHGYDLITLADDAAGLVRALGEANATVVGHDWGGLLAWTIGALRPKVVQRLVTVSAAHPLRLRHTALTDVRGHAARRALGYQLPLGPEKWLLKNDAARVGEILREQSAPGWPDERSERLYRAAFQIPGVARCAVEYHRWITRSLLSPDGLRYAHRMRDPIRVPVLDLHGALDPGAPPRGAGGSGRYVEARYRWRLIAGAGHYPHEERPDAFDAELLGWLSG